MRRRETIRMVSAWIRWSLALYGVLIVHATVHADQAKVNNAPNIVFILVDDLGWRDLSNEGSTFYESPNIDRLAASGMKFTRGYAACQVCSPSRASIQTGKYPARHGITDWIGAASGTAWKRNDRLLPAEYKRQLPDQDVTIAEALRMAGYRTFFAGKWHLGGKGSLPTDHGYEFNRGGNETGSPKGGFFAPFENPQLPDGPPGESLCLRLANETASFIREHRHEKFFAFMSFYSVHAPLQTTEARWQKYQQKFANVAVNLPPVRSRFVIDRTLPVRQVQDHPVYAGMIETMDQAVGIVLDQLEQLGLADNTVVVFTSDNGGVSSGDAFATSNLPLRGGKGRQWEGGIREPFYIRAPGVTQAGSTNNVPVCGIDFYPTLLELAGVPMPKEQTVDGVSLLPLLKGESIASRPLYWHYPHYGNQGGEPSSIIQQDDWKLIHYYEDGRDELYHLANDPSETTDVASQQPERTKQLRQQLDRWLKETGAAIPQLDPRFDAQKAAARTTEIRDQMLPSLERQHAEVLSAKWRPNPQWWKSKSADTGRGVSFEKLVLTDQYYCDGINYGDFNGDGARDVVAGPYWYAGPSFQDKYAIYPPVPLPPEVSPSNSMYSFVHDFSGDGRDDVLVLGRVHLHEAYWYENPGTSDGTWQKHFAFERVRGESPTLVDLDGDRQPELICHWDNRWGALHWSAQEPRLPWRFVPITEPKADGEIPQFYHGTGVGDVNRDGRIDLVLNEGWWEQPQDRESLWTAHPHTFSSDRGGAQMFACDVNGDGLNDILTAMNAHGWGLAWFEQRREGNQVRFVQHSIMGDRTEIEKYGVAFTQPHALDLADIDGDGLQDLIVGKRRWAHGPKGDIEPEAEPVLYWFQLQRHGTDAKFVPHLIDNTSGVGVQVVATDINRDGRTDILTASKLGAFVFLQK